MVKSLFITATGTDIGKTYISALILKKMKKIGINCGYYKPVLSGALKQNAKYILGDAKYVIDIADLEQRPEDCVSYAFEDAVSPHLAANIINEKISKEKLFSDLEVMKNKFEYLLIEGAGGMTTPLVLTDKETYLLNDFIKDIQSNVIIVADAGLGTINSVLLTTEFAKSKGINIKGIILNNFQETLICKNNKDSIEQLTGIKVIATVKRGDTEIDIDKDLFNV